jgi:hypothetical protein
MIIPLLPPDKSLSYFLSLYVVEMTFPFWTDITMFAHRFRNTHVKFMSSYVRLTDIENIARDIIVDLTIRDSVLRNSAAMPQVSRRGEVRQPNTEQRSRLRFNLSEVSWIRAALAAGGYVATLQNMCWGCYTPKDWRV